MKILFGNLLGLDSNDELFETMERLHEDLLRGRISLFPVTVNTDFWHSSRKKGKEAKKCLQAQTKSHCRRMGTSSFAVANDAALEDVTKHTVLMTSELAVKALASHLTALLLNLSLYNSNSKPSIADNLVDGKGYETRSRRLRSVLLETERLSLLIDGVMRRSAKVNIVVSSSYRLDVKIVKDWDCWLRRW